MSDPQQQDGNKPAGDDDSQTRKHYALILEEEVEAGLEELQRETGGLLFSGLSAGLDIGFGPFLMVVALTLMGGDLADPATRLLVAGLYPVGFVFVILGRSELFTEHTTLAALPVLAGRGTVAELGRLWALIYVANLAGAVAFAAAIAAVGPAIGAVEAAAMVTLAEELVGHSWWAMLASGILAGWLMGLLSWLVTAGRETTSVILLVWIVTFSIGLAGLHHSIAGTVEVLLGVFTGMFGATAAAAPGWADFGPFLLWSTLGNIAGGLVFVAIIKYTHAVRGEQT